MSPLFETIDKLLRPRYCPDPLTSSLFLLPNWITENLLYYGDYRQLPIIIPERISFSYNVRVEFQGVEC